MVYSHLRDNAIFFYRLCNCQSIKSNPQSSKGCGPRVTGMVRFIWGGFLSFLLYSRWFTGYGLQSSKGCASPSLLVQSSVYWVRLQWSKGCLFLPLVQLSVYQIRSIIIQKMYFSSTTCSVISILGMVIIVQGMLQKISLVQLAAYRVCSTIIQGMLFFYTVCAAICLESAKYGYSCLRFRLCSHWPTGYDL